MKNTPRVILLAAICFVIQSTHAQVRTPDSMVRKIFATLKAKDEKAFVALYPTGAQFSKMMRSLMEVTMKSETMKKMMEADEQAKHMNIDSLIDAQVAAFADPATIEKMQQSFAETFQKIIAKGEMKGVKWSEAMLTSFTADTTSSGEGDDASFAAAGLKGLKGVIDFKVGDKPYQLAYDKVIFLPNENGWFGAEFPQLARKGESLAPDADPTDSSVDTAAVAPAPKKNKTQTKGKAPAVKAKATGTKTPARKPKTKA